MQLNLEIWRQVDNKSEGFLEKHKLEMLILHYIALVKKTNKSTE